MTPAFFRAMSKEAKKTPEGRRWLHQLHLDLRLALHDYNRATARIVTAIAFMMAVVPVFAQQGPTVQYPPVLIRDEGSDVARVTRALNFTGAAVTCSNASGVITCNVTAGGSVTITEAEIDCGSAATKACSATVTDATVSGTSKLLITMSGNAATGRQADENEMDKLMCSAVPGSGSFVVHCIPLPGPVSGKYKLWYTVG